MVMLLRGEIIFISVAKTSGPIGDFALYTVEDLWSEWEKDTCFPYFGQTD